jgi:effector-binding domain-containing protein
MSDFAARNDISISSDTFTIYHDTDFREKDVDIEICAPVAGLGESRGGFIFRNTEPVPNMACTMVYGKFENIAGAYLAFANWLQEHNRYRMTGQSRQVVHRGPWNEEDPEKYLTEIQIPLERM